MISEGGDGKSGGERAALQTLRAARNRLAVAKRLDCGGLSTAFRARDVKSSMSGQRPSASQTRTPRRLNPTFLDWRKIIPPSEKRR